MFFIESKVELLNLWVEEFKNYFSIPSDGDIDDAIWSRLEKIEGSGLYKDEHGQIVETNGEYSFVNIFKNHPESSIIWSALEILLFGKMVTYSDAGEEIKDKPSNIRRLYEILISKSNESGFELRVSIATGAINLDSFYGLEEGSRLEEQNAFISDAVYFLIKTLNVSNNVDIGNINSAERAFKSAKRKGAIGLANYNNLDEVWNELRDYFEKLKQYERRISLVLSGEATTEEKDKLLKDRSLSAISKKCGDFVSGVFENLDFGFKNCSVVFAFKNLVEKSVTRFNNQYQQTNNAIAGKLQSVLHTKYSIKDAEELVNKYTEMISGSDVLGLQNGASELERLYNQITRLYEQNKRYEDSIKGKDALADLAQEFADLTVKCDDALRKIWNTKLSLEQRIKDIEAEERKKIIDSKREVLKEKINTSMLGIKRFVKEKLEFIDCKQDAQKVIDELDAEIEFFESIIGDSKIYGNELVTDEEKKDIDFILEKLNENLQKTITKRDDEALPESLFDDTRVVEKGRVVKIANGEGKEIDVLFSLLDEDFNELLFNENETNSTARFRDYSAYHDLVDAAIDVKRQPIFSNYGDITKYPYFIPFRYQVDSVRTMLSRFEGKGVFGDQVGLGKTLQTLMTADVIHRCGAIKNAVIVASKTNIDQWRKEAETKFRDKNGEEMFDVYPKLTAEEAKKTGTTKTKAGNYYNYKELIADLKKDENAPRTNKLKIYFISTNSLIDKNSSAIADIEKSNSISDLEILANRSFEPKSFGKKYNALNEDVQNEKCLEKLFCLATRLYNDYNDGVDVDLLVAIGETTLHGGNPTKGKKVEWDLSQEWKIVHNEMRNEYGEIIKEGIVRPLTEKYNSKLEEIRARINDIKETLRKGLSESIYTQKRLIDLFIFDEVQDILVSKKQGADEETVSTAKTIQEFIAKIQKKYCILVSATPIRSDLSDIFDLHYMVDKNKLGETREEAENRFYGTYCEGCRSLSEMAKSGSKKKFKALNGLINSMFTRKRLYDPDVKDSMRRHTATQEELELARSNNRNDYGGEKFIKLVKALGDYHYAKIVNESPLESCRDELLVLRNELFPKSEYNLEDEQFLEAIDELSRSVDTSADFAMARIQMKFREVFQETDRNICQSFARYYGMLLDFEKKDKNTDKLKNMCDILCSCINKGFLDFFRTKHKYSTIFLSDYIDWTRPVKRGVEIKCPTTKYKLDLFADAFVPNDDEMVMQSELVKENEDGVKDNSLVVALQTGKILVFEKGTEERRELYRMLSNSEYSFGEPRRVYLNVTDSDKSKYTTDELIDLGYFNKTIYSDLEKKNQLNEKEKIYLNTWTKNGELKDTVEEDDDEGGIFEQKQEQISKQEKSHRNFNFKMFSKFNVSGGNWNSIYMMDKTQRAGTDLNAANILIIGQLDTRGVGRNTEYLDPLDLEQLIGRVSRIGQTEECIIFTCLYNGISDNDNNQEFNKFYYDILADEKGFNLFGACQTEVSFVVPVVMACMRRLFEKECSYTESEITGEKFLNDRSEFKAVYKDKHIPIPSNVEKFPQMLKYLYDNRNEISIYYTKLEEQDDKEVVVEEKVFTGNDTIDAIKLMVEIYAEVLSHKTEEISKKDN